MKCIRCNGKGKYKTIFGNTIICDFCYGTGEVTYGEDDKIEPIGNKKPMTNEEWLDRKSTKEKAEWLFKLTYKCYWCGREYTSRSLSLFNEKECPFKKCMKDKKDFEKWLKEPYREERRK